MECARVQEMFMEDWAGTLDPAERAEFEAHLAGCASCRSERESLNHLWNSLGNIPYEEPSPAARERFNAMLKRYREHMVPVDSKQSQWTGLSQLLVPLFRTGPVLQFGLGVVVLVIGFVAGYLMRSAQNGREEMTSLRAEIHEMRRMVTISLLRQQSASERLKGVSWSSQITSPDPEFLSTLVHTLNYDSNVDVRLAAVDALARFAAYPGVRQNLIKSLSRQNSPLVQISLVDLLVQLHERQSIDVLKQLVNDASQNQQVRDRAQWGLQRLS